jgi:flagellar hook-length control protein FliK
MLTIPVPSVGAAKENPGTAALFGSKAKGKAASGAKNPFSALLASLREGKTEGAETKNALNKNSIKPKTQAQNPVTPILGKELAKEPAKEPVKERALGKAGASAAEEALDATNAELLKLKNKRGVQRELDQGLSAAALPGPFLGRESFKAAPRQSEAQSEGDKPAEVSSRKDAKRGADGKYSVIDLRLKIDAKETPEAQKNARGGSPERIEAPALSRVDGAGAKGGDTEGPAKPAELKTNGGSFSEVLAERLKANATDFVRAAQVVLKDGNLGLIRLRLEPEHLGGVKIELKLAEKQISGRIIVESDLAGEAFRSSIDSLKDAFASAGFETSSLEVEVRNGNGQQGGARQDGGADEPGSPRWSARLRELDAAVPPADGAGADGALNMIV